MRSAAAIAVLRLEAEQVVARELEGKASKREVRIRQHLKDVAARRLRDEVEALLAHRTVRRRLRLGPALRRVGLRAIEHQRIDRDVCRRGFRLEPRQLRQLAIDNEPLSDEHQHLRRVTGRQAVEERLQPLYRGARALARIGGDDVCLRTDGVLTDAHLALPTGAAAGSCGGASALALVDRLHRRVVLAFERHGIDDPQIVLADVGDRGSVDVLDAALHERVIGGEGDLWTVWDAGKRNAIGAIELADEAARRLDGRLPSSSRDARSIDDHHDEPAARRLGIARVWQHSGRAARTLQLDCGRHGDKLHRADGPRTAVDAQLEISSGEAHHRLTVAVDGADVYLNDVNRRLEPLNWRRGLRLVKKSGKCESEQKPVRTHKPDSIRSRTTGEQRSWHGRLPLRVLAAAHRTRRRSPLILSSMSSSPISRT